MLLDSVVIEFIVDRIHYADKIIMGIRKTNGNVGFVAFGWSTVLLVARASVRKLKEAAQAAGTVPLRDAALALVQSGETTQEEIDRVTFVA